LLHRSNAGIPLPILGRATVNVQPSRPHYGNGDETAERLLLLCPKWGLGIQVNGVDRGDGRGGDEGVGEATNNDSTPHHCGGPNSTGSSSLIFALHVAKYSTDIEIKYSLLPVTWF